MTDDGAPFKSTFSWAGEWFEYRMYPPDGSNPLIFLHDGLGSIGTWKDLPRGVAAATERPGIVYSRPGHGWSGPLRKPGRTEFMHHEALSTLFYFIRELEGLRPGAHRSLRWGVDLADLHRGTPLGFRSGPDRPTRLRRAGDHRRDREVVRRFETTDLVERMAKYHRDPEATFRAWSEIWLDPAFRHWNIESSLS